MNTLDVLLLIFLGAFALFGFWFGTVHAIGSFVGMILATFVASRFQEQLTAWAIALFSNPFAVKVVVFFLIYFIISKLVGFFFSLLEKPLNLVTHLPFIRSIDRLIGALIGFFEGLLVIGIAVFIMSRYDLPPLVAEQMKTSQLAPWFVGVSFVLQPLIPASIKKLQSIINY